ncbi:hypothetical protein [Fusibacter sp. 3D3]|uniref:hypothetical protein n=1 Tax=Fusibacter sp. 3D3 TaxID=1048380 RepID=UPI000858A22F|nr:hypothetical protein [Fusibacter sp. 3D3]GAU79824.1 hypothetical protein F3D3_4489 [Fusibacter sp. 3D3]
MNTDVIIVFIILLPFMQNIGAVALFLPAVKKIGNKSGISHQKLIIHVQCGSNRIL